MSIYLPKKLIILFLCCFFLLSNAQAGRILINGTVKYPDGSPAAFKGVYIRTDSSITATTCKIYNQKHTNQNGFYQDTIECNLTISAIIISVQDCNGSIITKTFIPNSNNLIEANFTICSTPVCSAWFIFFKDTLNTGSRYKFASNGSTTSPGDSIIERIWSWGNGDSLKGNSMEAVYNYSNNGNYKICLTIKTKKGCINTICREINVMPICKATFRYSAEPATGLNNGYSFNFNSSNSTTPSAGDEIIERNWKWGDGTVENGNKVELKKTFTTVGNYNTCLVIKTKNGCIDTFCTSISVPVPGQAGCKASFNYRVLNRGKALLFNSQDSYPLLGDSIIKRTWTFGDGSSLEGNKAEVVKEYRFTGKFNVCLEIKTRNGCINKVCKPIEIRDSTDTNRINGVVNIISVHPNPVVTNLTAIVWSEREQVQAELIITNLNGTRKFVQRTILVKGNNVYTIPVGNLPKGTYFFKLSTGLDTSVKQFYKM